MADFLFDDFKEQLLTGATHTFDLDTNTISVNVYAAEDMTPVSTWTNFTTNAPTFYTGATKQDLTNKTISSAGVFDDTVVTTFTALAVDGTKDVDGLIIYQDGGTDGTRYYIAHIDSFTAVRPNGGDITITWNASGIFAL